VEVGPYRFERRGWREVWKFEVVRLLWERIETAPTEGAASSLEVEFGEEEVEVNQV